MSGRGNEKAGRQKGKKPMRDSSVSSRTGSPSQPHRLAEMDADTEAFNRMMQEELESGGVGKPDRSAKDIEIDKFNEEFILQCDGDDDLDDLDDIAVFNMATVRNSLPGIAPSSLIFEPPVPALDNKEVTSKLIKIDERRQGVAERIQKHLAVLAASRVKLDAFALLTERNELRKEASVLKNLLDEVTSLDHGKHKTNATYRRDLQDSMKTVLDEVDKACSFGSKESEPSSLQLSPGATRIRTDELPLVRLRRLHFMTLVPMLLVVVLSVLGNVPSSYANSSLRVLAHFIPMVLRGGTANTPIDAASDRLVKELPTDIRTVKKRLHLAPILHTFAICPECSKLHRPTKLPNGQLDFPRKCTGVKGAFKKRCEAIISKDTLIDGEVRRAPLKPYHIQDFDQFKARLVMNPVIEALLIHGQACEEKEEMEDLKDGKRLPSIVGPDGRKFMDPSAGELRLAWNMSTDWGNPFLNKTSGKHVSVGSVAATCMNLPPLYRYKMENVYLATVIPGPQEPTVLEILDYFDVIVDVFVHSYNHGTHYSSTYMHPNGILERSVIAAFVGDLPAARKCTGMASPASDKNMCHLCHMSKKNINELDMTKPCWKARDVADNIRDSIEWRDEIRTTEQEKIFTRTGVRWSPFFRLPYWNPHECVIIDGMHNLLLGLVQHHCRHILAIQEDPEEKTKELKPADASKVRARLKSGDVSFNFIKKLATSDLLSFCADFNIDTSKLPTEGPWVKRKHREALFKGITGKTSAQKQSPQDPTSSTTGTRQGEVHDDATTEFESCRAVPGLSMEEIRMVQKTIRDTHRPRWHKSPPHNLGEKGHGKLKADQWRSAIEFDIPIALAKLAGDESSDHLKLFRSTMLLAIAMRYVTSHKMSEHRIERYTHFMQEYLKSIRKIDPSTRLKPNHHNSLHIGHYLRLFGPMHGWWMFVYERVIGNLQRTNTNHKIGELEKTMLTGFASAGNLKAVLNHPDAGDLISEIASLMEGEEVDRGSLFADRLAQKDVRDTSTKARWLDNRKAGKKVVLESVVFDAFKDQQSFLRRELDFETWVTPKDVTAHKDIEIHGKMYSSSVRSSGRFVFCKSLSGEYWPSDIHQIFSIPHPTKRDEQVYFLVLKAYSVAAQGVRNPFKEFPEFGATIWGKETMDEAFIVPVLPTLNIVHGIKTSWDERHMIMKPLLRVSRVLSSLKRTRV